MDDRINDEQEQEEPGVSVSASASVGGLTLPIDHVTPTKNFYEARDEIKSMIKAGESITDKTDPNFINTLREHCLKAEDIYRQTNGTLPDGTTSKVRQRRYGVKSGQRLPRSGSSPATMIERHRRIAQLAALGASNAEIAETVGMSVENVSRIKCQPAVQLIISVLQRKEDNEVRNVTEKIALFAGKAFDVVQLAVEDPDIPLQERAKLAFKALAIAGHSPVHKVAVKSMHVVASQDSIKAMLERAKVAGMLEDPSQPSLIDVTNR